INTASEADRQFSGDAFVTNTQIAAYNVRLAMDLPAGYKVEEFHGEQISTNAGDVREQHLAPNDAMLYHLVLRDCAPDTRDGSETLGFSATWSDGSADQQSSTTATLAQMEAGENRELIKAAAILAYADVLRPGAYTDSELKTAVADAISTVEAADTALGGDA